MIHDALADLLAGETYLKNFLEKIKMTATKILKKFQECFSQFKPSGLIQNLRLLSTHSMVRYRLLSLVQAGAY